MTRSSTDLPRKLHPIFTSRGGMKKILRFTGRKLALRKACSAHLSNLNFGGNFSHDKT